MNRRSVKNDNKRVAMVVGTLFLIVMVAFTIGLTLIDSVLKAPDVLLNVYPNRVTVMAGVLLELIEITAIVGIVVLMFPILRRQNESMALGYVVFRALECVVLIVIAASALFLIGLSREYVAAGAPVAGGYQMASALLIDIRDLWGHQVLDVFYFSGALLFFTLLFQSRLIPRVLAIAGQIGAALVGVSAVLAFFGIDTGLIFGIPMGLIEIALGIWLIARGFDSGLPAPHSTDELSIGN